MLRQKESLFLLRHHINDPEFSCFCVAWIAEPVDGVVSLQPRFAGFQGTGRRSAIFNHNPFGYERYSRAASMRMLVDCTTWSQSDNAATQIVVPNCAWQVVRCQIDESDGIIHAAYTNGLLRCYIGRDGCSRYKKRNGQAAKR